MRLLRVAKGERPFGQFTDMREVPARFQEEIVKKAQTDAKATAKA